MDLAAVPSLFTLEYLLLSLAQYSHPLANYVMDFLELSHLVTWSDGTLKDLFLEWGG